MRKFTIILSFILLFSMLMFQGCTSNPDGESDASSAELSENSPDVVMTLEELTQYDGKDGNPAYIAVDGIIYDVTDVPQWRNGAHNGFSAGQDLTDEITSMSPHGVSKLKNIPVVARLEN